jgi:hypothetical protein
MVISALAQKHNVIENIVNVLIQEISVSIAIVKIVTISLLLILIQISIQQMIKINQRKKKLSALVQKVAVIKIIVNVLK